MSGAEDMDLPFIVEDDGVAWPWAQVPMWVALAPISDRAVRVYAILRGHVNTTKRDDKGRPISEDCWPSQGKIATVLGLSKPEPVGKAIKELVSIGAVTSRVVATDRGRLMIYRVRVEPLNGRWDGLRRTSDIYEPGELDALRSTRVRRRSTDIPPDVA